MQEIKLIKILIPLLGYYPWSIPAIFTLGILSSLLEGIGITLLIPFLQSFDSQVNQQTNSNFLIQYLIQILIKLFMMIIVKLHHFLMTMFSV